MIHRRRFTTATLALLAAAPIAARAQALPIERARLLVGFPAGGTVDALARRLADKLRGPYAKAAVL
jgi:tripartite-type tricarboxylate transporter receptor subunit TctC